jgi:hypothetical protein
MSLMTVGCCWLDAHHHRRGDYRTQGCPINGHGEIVRPSGGMHGLNHIQDRFRRDESGDSFIEAE